MFIYAFVRSAYLYLSYPMRILLHQTNMIIDTFYADDIQLSIPCLISLNDNFWSLSVCHHYVFFAHIVQRRRVFYAKSHRAKNPCFWFS